VSRPRSRAGPLAGKRLTAEGAPRAPAEWDLVRLSRACLLAPLLALALVPAAARGSGAHDAKVTTHRPSAAQRSALKGAIARAGFPASEWKLGDPALSANPAGYAIATPIARNPRDQGNGVAIFAQRHGSWRVVAHRSSFEGPVAGVPAAVLEAFLAVPGEGSLPD